MTDLTEADLVVGRIYEAKRRREGPFGASNDRVVVWIDSVRGVVQYDSDTVRDGNRYPIISVEKFLRWAKRVKA